MKQSRRNLIVCGLSILLLNYNIAINSYAIILLERTQSIEFSKHPTIIHSTVLLGLLIGTSLFGFLNHFSLAVRSSFKLCSVLVVIGGFLSIVPGYLSFLKNSTKLFDFSAARFILGLGTGGLLAGVSSVYRENAAKEIGNSKMTFVFGPIGSLGLILAPAIIAVFDKTQIVSEDWAWKIALAAGSLPCLVLLFLDVDSSPFDGSLRKSVVTGQIFEFDEHVSQLSIFCNDFSSYMKSVVFKLNLAGSCTAVVCFDAIYYGNFLLIVRIVDHLFLKTAYNPRSFLSVAVMGTFCGVCFWIGGCISVISLKKISVLALQLHGFILMSITFAVLAIMKVVFLDKYWPIFVFVYSFTFFFAGCGPAPMTYLVPSLIFPRVLRSPLSGFIASVGKAGAICGAIIAHYLYVEISTLMFIFSAISLIGAGSTILLLHAQFLRKTITERRDSYDPLLDHSDDYLQEKVGDDVPNLSGRLP